MVNDDFRQIRSEQGLQSLFVFQCNYKKLVHTQGQKNSAQLKKEVHLEDIGVYEKHESLIAQHGYYEKRREKEFWESLWSEIDTWDAANLKENERKVLEAVKILLSNTDDIEIFNKKAIYLYLREITGLNTKQVVNNLNKLRSKYRNFKDKWNKGEI